MSTAAIVQTETLGVSQLAKPEACLVTGGTGFLGRHLVDTLASAGDAVIVLSRRKLPNLQSITGDLAAGDLDLSDLVFSTVYHVAGFAHVVPRTPAEGEMFFRVNAAGTRNLLNSLTRCERLPEAFVLISTVAVYGREQGELLDETTPRGAADPYGVSKCQAEDAVLQWCLDHDVRSAIVRLPLVVGRNAPGNLKMMIEGLKRGRYCGVGSGSARRSMVLAADVSRILPTIAKQGGTFNLTDGYHPSFLELERELCKSLGRKPPLRLPLGLVKAAGRVGETVNGTFHLKLPVTTATARKMTCTLTFSDSHARETLGWKPEPVLNHVAEWVA